MDMAEGMAGKGAAQVTAGEGVWKAMTDHRLCIRRYRVPSAKLKGRVRAVFLSDLHGSRINICGVDDVVAGKRLFEEQLARLESVCTFEAFTVLLAHRPELAARYLKSPYDLVLAGHAHGGQWRIPGRLNGLYAPHQGLFPKYAGGMYRFGDARMVVGRGLTCERPGIPRIFNPPEIVVLELEQKN